MDVANKGRGSSDLYKGSTVLIIDENSSELRSIEEYARDLEWMVLVVRDYKSAQEMLSKLHPELLIFASQTPSDDGFLFCQQLHENPEAQVPPIAFLSESNDSLHRTSAFSLGAADYIVLPCEKDELQLRLCRLLREAARQKSLEKELSQLQAKCKELTQTIELEKSKLERVEGDFKESELRYAQMFETNLAVKLLIEPATGRIVGANQSAINFYGYDKDTLTSMQIMDLNMLSESEVRDEMELARTEERLYFNFRHKLASGEIRDVEVYSGPVGSGEDRLLYSIIHDVTDRSLTEKALRDNEERFRTIVTNSTPIVFMYDLDGKILLSEGKMLSNLGFKPGELVGQNVFEMYKDFPYVLERLQGATRGIKYEGVVELGPMFFESFYSPYYNTQGEVAGVLGMALDITERKTSEEKLKRNEENLLTTLNSIGDAVIATDLEGRVVRMNPIAEKLTGWRFAESCQKPLSDIFRIIHAHTRKSAENPVAKVLSTNNIVGLANHTVLISRSGKEYHIADSGAPIRSENGETTGVVLVFRDITEEYVLQERLRQGEKMQAIGQLAGGIAHDFNNMLGGIVGAAELLQLNEDVLADEESKMSLEIIMQASEQAAELTSKLLAFGRKGKMTSTAIDVHRIVDDTVAILHRTIDKKITIFIKKNARNPTISGDNTALQNALLNIGINASHAMSEGGEIHISTQNVQLGPDDCKILPFELEAGPFIEIVVKDTGCGIPPGNLPKIFEPFFTTRTQGKGTGLGLAAVYGTIIEHYGAITVQSQLEQGSTFRLLLPSSESTIFLGRRRPEVTLTGSGKVLVVDDERVIRKTGKMLLERMGYEVFLAENGLEAVKMYQNMGDTIDLVIMDMIMPEMNGREAFFRIKELDNDSKIVISSGFTKDESLDDLKCLGLSGVIRKPYRSAELSQLLKDVFADD